MRLLFAVFIYFAILVGATLAIFHERPVGFVLIGLGFVLPFLLGLISERRIVGVGSDTSEKQPAGFGSLLLSRRRGNCKKSREFEFSMIRVPTASIARSIGSPGTVLISRGVLALLDEEELDSVLQVLAGKIRGIDVVFQTALLSIAMRLYGFLPERWKNLRIRYARNSFSTFTAVILIAGIRFLIWLSPRGSVTYQKDESWGLRSATRKISSFNRLTQPEASPTFYKDSLNPLFSSPLSIL